MKKLNYNSKLLLNELNIFFKTIDLDSFISGYKENGWTVFLNEDSIDIKTQKNIYHLGIVINDAKYYWHLFPYENSYYLEEFVSGQDFLKKLLTIIFENEKT